MPIAVSAYSGSLAFGATETSLVAGAVGSGTATTSVSLQVVLDTKNFVANARYALRIYRAAMATATKGLLYYEPIGNTATHDPGWISPSIMVGHFWDVTLQNLGTTTDVQIPYSLDTIG